MLEYDKTSSCRILGVDPGGSNLGLAVVDLTLPNVELSVPTAFTSFADLQVNEDDYRGMYRGMRYVRHRAQAEIFEKALNWYKPDLVAIERPFVDKRPDAFAALVELKLRLTDVVTEYDPSMRIEIVSATQAKKAVGVKDFSSKEAVRVALSKFNIKIPDAVWNEMDEHSIDAVAVASTIALRIKDGSYDYAI